MSTSSSSIVRTPDILSRWCRVMHDTQGLTDRQIALKPYFSGIPAGTINTIRKHGIVPKKWHRKLRIRCPRCGRYSHEYDCSIEKPVPVEAKTYNPATHALKRKAPRKPKRRAPVARIYAGTDESVAEKRLKDITKNEWKRVEKCDGWTKDSHLAVLSECRIVLFTGNDWGEDDALLLCPLCLEDFKRSPTWENGQEYVSIWDQAFTKVIENNNEKS